MHKVTAEDILELWFKDHNIRYRTIMEHYALGNKQRVIIISPGLFKAFIANSYLSPIVRGAQWNWEVIDLKQEGSFERLLEAVHVTQGHSA